MKLALTLPACILAAASLAALGRPSEPVAGPTFRFELADGAIVTGSIKAERVVVRTPYGQFELDPSAVRRIEQLSPSLDAYLIHGTVDGERTDFVDGVPESLAKTLQRVTRVANTYGGMATAKATAPCLYPVEGKGEIPRVLVEGDKKLYPIKGSWAARLQSGWHYYDENHVLLNKTVAEVLPHYESKVDYYMVPAGSSLGAPVERPKEATLVLVLELRDGTRVRGKTKLDTFAVSCPYGKLSVPLADIRGIVVEQLSAKGETWQQVRLEMCNGDRLTGRPKTTKLDVETAYGKLSVPLADVARIEVCALQPDAPLPAGLVLHYAFDKDEGGKVFDGSGRGHHGAIGGQVRYEASPRGKAIRTSSRDTYVVCDAPGFNLDGWRQLTVSAWIKLDAHTTYGRLVNHGKEDVSDGFSLNVGGEYGGKPRDCVFSVYFGEEKGAAVTVKRFADPGQWYQVAGVYDGKTVRYYVNGREVGSADVPAELTDAAIRQIPGTRLSIGKCSVRVSWYDTHINGLIDDVRIYNRALSAEEIKRVYSSDGAGPVLHLGFDTDEGAKVTDKSGRGNHGKVHGATWTAKGKVGGAYEFDGKDDYIELGPSNLYKSKGQLSACAWVNIRGKVAIVLSNYHGGNAYNGQFFFAYSDGVDVLFGQGPNQYVRYISKARPIPPNEWHHVAFSYDEGRGDGNKIKLYLDGQEMGAYAIQSEGNGGPVLDIAENLRIMAHRDTPTGTLSDGLIDEVMMFNRALSGEEIRQIAGMSPFAVPPRSEKGPSAFSGAGSGTAEDPYRITNVEQLQEMRNHRSNAHFILMNDIDASATQKWNWDGTKYLGFEPVGMDYDGDGIEPHEPFTGGSLNGNGHVIKDLYINRPDQDWVGLFGFTTHSFVCKVGLERPNVTGRDHVGALSGFVTDQSQYRTVMHNACSAGGTVRGNRRVGGLLGRLHDAAMVDCHSTATVTGKETVGGLAGCADFSEVRKCHASGAVTGSVGVGGLLGTSHATTFRKISVHESFATGAVRSPTGRKDPRVHGFGGLIGYCTYDRAWGSAANSYNCTNNFYKDHADNPCVGVGNCPAIGSDIGPAVSSGGWTARK